MTSSQISRALVYLLSAFERARYASRRTYAMVFTALAKLRSLVGLQELPA